MTRPTDRSSCADVAARLRALERTPSGVGPSAEARQPEIALLRAHLVACAACRSALGARLAGLEGLGALRSRQVPQGVLDDLKGRVLTQLRAGGSGGMSPAFLDAPASLARWRAVALAASVLLAVGAGLVASGRLGPAHAPQAPDFELRDALLPRLQAGRRLEPSDDLMQPVVFPGHGMSGFFAAPPAPDVGARVRAREIEPGDSDE